MSGNKCNVPPITIVPLYTYTDCYHILHHRVPKGCSAHCVGCHLSRHKSWLAVCLLKTIGHQEVMPSVWAWSHTWPSSLCRELSISCLLKGLGSFIHVCWLISINHVTSIEWQVYCGLNNYTSRIKNVHGVAEKSHTVNVCTELTVLVI